MELNHEWDFLYLELKDGKPYMYRKDHNGGDCIRYIREDIVEKRIAEKIGRGYTQLMAEAKEAQISAFNLQAQMQEDYNEWSKKRADFMRQIMKDGRAETDKIRKAAKADAAKINSDACKLRMTAYNQAKQWDKSISAKFDYIIAKNAKSKNVFDRLMVRWIWKKMKADWDKEKIKKEYGK